MYIWIYITYMYVYNIYVIYLYIIYINTRILTQVYSFFTNIHLPKQTMPVHLFQ